MRNLYDLNQFRDVSENVFKVMGTTGNHTCGAFHIPIATHPMKLKVIASVGAGWDHVSASLPDRCPTWAEMELVAKMFFLPNEAAMQLHVPENEHVNYHPHCLHWWRPLHRQIFRPPAALVGGGARR